MIHLLRLPLLLTVAGLLMAAPAAAQFDTPNRQFHDKTTFRLEGRHLSVPCASCHLNGTYKSTPTQCVDCHWVRRQDDRFRLQLGRQCEQCHRATSWTGARFDHTALTSMPLGAAHSQLACQSCHANGTFRSAQATCIGCHLKDYQKAQTPNHVSAGFPTTCDTCHRVNHASFHQARFEHQAVFPLVGQHATQTCAACHTNGVYKGTAKDCIGCHRTAYDRTTTPNHAAAGFSTDCSSCHKATDSSFRGATFNHAAVFPLVGRHATQTCAACHTNGVYKGTAKDCIGCHRTAYDRTTTPNHAAAGFGTDCTSCHKATDASWSQGTFNHRFPISSGRHKAPCASCHQSGTSYANFTCLTCHEHAQSSMDSKHRGRNGYRYDSRACYGCHPTGRGD